MKMVSQGWRHLLISPRSVYCSWQPFLLLLLILTVSEQGAEAFTGLTIRQVESNTCQPTIDTFTITTQEEADLLQNCTTIQGSVLIQSPNLTSLTLPNIQQIGGYLRITTSPLLQNISAPNLTTVSGLILKDLPLFSFKYGAYFPLLTNLTHLDWENLPSMTEQYTQFLVRERPAEMLRIVNTSMTRVTFEVISVDVLNISNNAYLRFIEMPNLVNTSQSLTIGNNGYLEAPNTSLQSYTTGTNVGLENLVTAGTIQLSGVQYLEMGNLERVISGDLILTGNTMTFPAYLGFAMPNLTSIMGGLEIVNNTGVEYVSMDKLQTLGTLKESYAVGLLFEGNTLSEKSWGTDLSFDALEVVEGGITIDGPISEVSLPSLSSFNVPVSINSTSLPFSCTSLDEIHRVSIKKQAKSDQEPYLCRASPAGQTKDQAIHEKNNKLSKGGIAGIVVGVLIAVGILGTGTWWWFWGRKRVDVLRGDGGDEGGDDRNAGHELPMYRREALPGEELPAYKENESAEGSIGDEEGDVTSRSESLPVVGVREEHLDRSM